MTFRRASRIVLVAALALLCGVPLPAQDSRIPGGDLAVPLGADVRNGKLVFSSEDGSFQWWFDSRIQIDAAVYNENLNPISNGSVLRRLTFAMKATLWKNWQAEVDVDFAEAVLDLRDMWAQYTFPTFNLSLRAGNFKEPFGMERLNSSRLLTFLERSTPSNGFAFGRRVGIMGRYWTDFGQVSAGVFGHEAGTKIQSTDALFVTLFFGRIDPDTGEVTYVNAGHNPPLLYSGSQSRQPALQELERTGIPIGVGKDSIYEQRILYLNPGDFIVLYTDGVPDAINTKEEPFGTDRLKQIILTNHNSSGNNIIHALENAINQHTGSQPTFDDITIVVIKRL